MTDEGLACAAIITRIAQVGDRCKAMAKQRFDVGALESCGASPRSLGAPAVELPPAVGSRRDHGHCVRLRRRSVGYRWVHFSGFRFLDSMTWRFPQDGVDDQDRQAGERTRPSAAPEIALLGREHLRADLDDRFSGLRERSSGQKYSFQGRR